MPDDIMRMPFCFRYKYGCRVFFQASLAFLDARPSYVRRACAHGHQPSEQQDSLSKTSSEPLQMGGGPQMASVAVPWSPRGVLSWVLLSTLGRNAASQGHVDHSIDVPGALLSPDHCDPAGDLNLDFHTGFQLYSNLGGLGPQNGMGPRPRGDQVQCHMIAPLRG